MKTDDLIAALAADAQSVSRPIGRTLALAVAGGAVGATILFAVMLGMRPDVATAMASVRPMGLSTLSASAANAVINWSVFIPRRLSGAWRRAP